MACGAMVQKRHKTITVFKATEMGKGLERKAYEERLRAVGVLRAGQRS